MGIHPAVRVRGRSVSVSLRACAGILAAILFVFPGAGTASAGPTGSVSGFVYDPLSQAVSGARVTLRSPAGVVRDTLTGPRGQFAFDALQAGTYDVTVIVEGFRTDPARVTVRDGADAPVAFTLRLSAISETLVVSSSFVETPLSDSPAGATAISAQDIRARQFVTVADAMRLAPGAAVAVNGGLGAVTSAFPRGGESDFTMVLVDGVKLNSFGGGFDFGHLTTGGVASVEVVRGPQSAVFGADAIGGVVQVRTAVGGPASAGATYEAGGLGTTRLVAGTTGTAGAIQWGAHLERLSSNGWTDDAPGTTTKVSNDDYAGTSVAMAASWQPRAGTTFRLDSRVGRNERGNPGPFGSNPIGAFPGIDTVARGKNALALGAASITHELGARTAVRARASWMQLDSDFASAWGDSMSNTHRWSAHGQLDRSFGGALSATVGVDTEGERAESTYITDASASRVPVTRQVTGYFAEARVRVGSRLAVTAGLRLEHIVRAALAADPLSYAPRPAMARDAVVSPNPRVAASYYLRTSADSGGNWSRVHASAGTGIRAPDAFELAFTDNPGLKPEQSRSVDAGIEQSLFGGRLVIDVTAYTNTYDDLIVAVGRSMANVSLYRTDNIANARARGADVSAAWRTLSGLEARVAYSFTDSEVLAVDGGSGTAPAPFSVGDALIRRPRHQASVDLLLNRPRWTAFARASGRNRVLDVEPNYGAYGGLFYADGYGVVDAGGSVRLGRFAELVVRVDNLLDRSYESALGYPAPGRRATAGIRVAASR